MQCIYIYIGFTSSFRWITDYLHLNKELLNKHRIEIVMEHEYSSFYKTIKYYDIESRLERKAFAPVLQKMEACRSTLRTGKSLLFFFHTPEPATYKQFAAMLRENRFFSRYPVKVLVGIGNPLCAFEIQIRSETPLSHFYANDSPKTHKSNVQAISLASRYAHLHECVALIRKVWGDQSVELAWSQANVPVARPDAEHGNHVARWIGCDHMQLLDTPPKHRAGFQSWDGQCFYSIRSIRDNVWPEMSEDVYLRQCYALDATWEPAVVTPLNARELLVERGEQDRRQLEAELGISKGTLDGPDWLQTAQQSFFDKPTYAAHAQTMAAALPLQVAAPLAKRFSQDLYTLGNPLRKDCIIVFLRALQEAHPTQGSIGDPLPPVELTVLTMAYNHENYITQCLESVLEQRTDFPVRHVVLDHCSTDQTPAIIAAYASKHTTIQPVLLASHRDGANVSELFSRCRSRYAALCDGDDYFTDPYKLQKQVDFLEKNPDCALCFHPVAVVYDNGTHPPHIYPPENCLPGGIKEKNALPDLFKGNMIQTNSVVYRWRFTEGLPAWFHAELCPGDWYWHLLHAEMGAIGYIPEVMAVYRRHDKAMYYNSGNILEHRSKYGMNELHCYDVVNKHFNNTYFEEICRLANDVFANFAELKVNNNASIFLDTACNLYPEFAMYFMNQIKIISSKAQHA
jgi:glycosyltransferase involved in cell wall biosynthesis